MFTGWVFDFSGAKQKTGEGINFSIISSIISGLF